MEKLAFSIILTKQLYKKKKKKVLNFAFLSFRTVLYIVFVSLKKKSGNIYILEDKMYTFYVYKFKKTLQKSKPLFPPGSVSKKSAYNEGDPVSIPGSGRSPGEGNGNHLQYFCLENSMDRGVQWLQSMGSQRVGHQKKESEIQILQRLIMVSYSNIFGRSIRI